LPSARRERKNLSACSPLMARWFELQRRTLTLTLTLTLNLTLTLTLTHTLTRFELQRRNSEARC